jgi:carboxypeptidase C (cathepsin A)
MDRMRPARASGARVPNVPKRADMQRFRTFLFALFTLAAAAAVPTLAVAADPAPAPSPSLPAETPVITHHHVHIAGTDIAYTARAGVLVVRGSDGKPTTSMSYVAYTRDDAADHGHRPIAFIYNGGPGSSTVWLHLGAFGPRRVVIANATTTPPAPYHMVDNDDSLLDVADLVFIDAPGTGYGRAYDPKAVYGIDQDAGTFATFIQRYLTVVNRWNSPKFLIGESYGTTRSANLVNVLAQRGIACNGVVLISTVLDYATIVYAQDNDLPYVVFLPSMAAVAAYHHALPQQPANLDAFLAEVRHFAGTEYAAALLQGDRLDPQTRARIIDRLHAYTGLSAHYIDLANLRVSPDHFEKELLRDQRRTIGRLDSRFTGIDRDATEDSPDYDPADTALSPVYTALFHLYSADELNWHSTEEYRITNYGETFQNWDFKRTAGGFAGRVLAPEVVDDLRQALSQNPALRVFAANGLYDLATPFMNTEYTLAHMELDPTLIDHVRLAYYPSGHMIYADPASHARLSADLRSFITGLAR